MRVHELPGQRYLVSRPQNALKRYQTEGNISSKDNPIQLTAGLSHSTGSIIFKIDGEVVLNNNDLFDPLASPASGVDINERGQSFHIEHLGLIDHGDKPNCVVHVGDVLNNGIQSTDSEGLPGVMGTSMSCVHDWYC